MEGRTDEINTCIACNQACLDHTFKGLHASCLVNPYAGNETGVTVSFFLFVSCVCLCVYVYVCIFVSTTPPFVLPHQPTLMLATRPVHVCVYLSVLISVSMSMYVFVSMLISVSLCVSSYVSVSTF